MFKIIDNFLDRTTMYLVVLYSLIGLWAVAIFFSVIGLLAYTIVELLASGAVIVGTAILSSLALSSIFKVRAQTISSLITALILFFILAPSADKEVLFGSFVVTLFAIASKYVFVVKKQHLFNPVAIGIVAATLCGFGAALWWVASPLLLVPVLAALFLVVKKVRQWPMVLAFLGTAFVVFLFEEWRFGNDIRETWSLFWLSYPALFLAAFMLTEPFTTPSTKRWRITYGMMTGFLFSTAIFVPWFAMTPELALVLANAVFFSTTVRQKLFLSLQSSKEVAPNIFEYTFTKPAGLRYEAGQYLEWMLPHKGVDKRGTRRYFTIASAPSETDIRVAMKLPEKMSSFKKAMSTLAVGDIVIGSQRAGDFVLPKDTAQKIGWIAGGIGVTPFVSQARELKTKNQKRDIVLFYATATAADAAYKEDLSLVAKVIAVVSSGEVPVGGLSGYVTKEVIKDNVKDYLERTWYVSGPPPMVEATTKALVLLGVPKRKIVRDFFPGLA